MAAIAPLKIKILILGPPKSGKTTIANYLADSSDISLNVYRPTQGVRIVEFESNELELNGERVDAEIELWDCSGDRKYKRCWPAVRRNADGVILVCRPDDDKGSALLPWYEEFVQRGNIDPSLVLVLLHTTNDPSSSAVIDDTINTESYLLPQMSGFRVIPLNINRDDDNLRLEFNAFLCRVIQNVKFQKVE
ncbi:Intraflagellar transport associated protein [Dirofilaria immitis]